MAKSVFGKTKLSVHPRFIAWWEGVLFIGAFSLVFTSCLKDEDMCPDGMVLIKKEASATDVNWFDVCIIPPDTEPEPEIGDAGNVDGGDVGPGEGECPCSGDEYCDTTLNPPTCLAPPTGQGEPCQTDADCAGYEADFCENFVSFTCLVQYCDVEANNCTADYICCDFSWLSLPTQCVSRELTGGVCYEP